MSMGKMLQDDEGGARVCGKVFEQLNDGLQTARGCSNGNDRQKTIAL